MTNSANTPLKSVLSVLEQPRSNWIGDGFRVYDMFNYRKDTELHTPFLLLHYTFRLLRRNNSRFVLRHKHRRRTCCRLQRLGRQMCIPHRDLRIAMTEDLLNLVQTPTT